MQHTTIGPPLAPFPVLDFFSGIFSPCMDVGRQARDLVRCLSSSHLPKDFNSTEVEGMSHSFTDVGIRVPGQGIDSIFLLPLCSWSHLVS